MTEENEKLARTTAGKLTYSNMKETIIEFLEILAQLEMKLRHQLLKKTYFVLVIEEEVVEEVVVEEAIVIRKV